MEFANKVYNVLLENNLHIDGQINFCKNGFQRFRVKGSWKRGKPLFVCILNGGVAFGDWRDPSTWKTWFEKSLYEISMEERKQRKLEQFMLEKEQEQIRNKAIWRAQLLLDHVSWNGRTCDEVDPEHPYVYRKRIIPYNAYQCRSVLVIPITNIDGKLQSLQFIKPNGDKRFKRNTTGKHGMVLIGGEIQDKCYICEGWATGCTIHEVTNAPVACAMSASNIRHIALLLRKKYLHAEIIIAADNDEIGLESANDAAKLINARVLFPDFTNDFNDLFIMKGFDEVEHQLSIKEQNA